MYYLTRQVAFEASHALCIPELSDKENYELFGPAVNVHGHNYVVEVTIEGIVSNNDGMVINLTDLDQLLRDQVARSLRPQIYKPPTFGFCKPFESSTYRRKHSNSDMECT